MNTVDWLCFKWRPPPASQSLVTLTLHLMSYSAGEGTYPMSGWDSTFNKTSYCLLTQTELVKGSIGSNEDYEELVSEPFDSLMTQWCGMGIYFLSQLQDTSHTEL